MITERVLNKDIIDKKVKIGVAFLTEDGSCPHTKNIMKVLLKHHLL